MAMTNNPSFDMNLDDVDELEAYVMVAGIDFGTTFSGYGFSFKGSEKEIKLNKNWGDSQGFLSFKAPTSVLLNAGEEFEAFGFHAEQNYIDADDEDGDETVENEKHLFRNFKMMLHSKKSVTTSSTICSVGGHIYPAMDIFAHALRFLKQKLVLQLSSQLKHDVDHRMIRWVITVPAIWSDQSKQFMREAAFRAELIQKKDSKQLIIAIEPEAASFYCRTLELALFTDEKDLSFPSGTRYLVLDCGGGTNDMVVHEVILDYKVKEICAINGGSWGGNRVNEKFIELIKEILGDEFITSYQQSCPQEWFNFLAKFERAKRNASNDGQSKIRVEVPYNLAGKYAGFERGNSMKKTINQNKEQAFTFSNGCIVLGHERVKELFEEVIAHIIQGVNDVLQRHEVEEINYIFLVGGFAECDFLKAAVTCEFEAKGLQVLVPNEAQLAVLKGAVLYGHHQDQVISRITRRTYGSNSAIPFIDHIHDTERRYIDEVGQARCRNVFWSFVEIDEEVDVGSTISKSYTLLKSHKDLNIEIFSIPRKAKKQVQYTDDPDVIHVGKIRLKTPNLTNAAIRNLTLKMTFGNTEILVEAVDETTGNVVSTTVDFLCE